MYTQPHHPYFSCYGPDRLCHSGFFERQKIVRAQLKQIRFVFELCICFELYFSPSDLVLMILSSTGDTFAVVPRITITQLFPFWSV